MKFKTAQNNGIPNPIETCTKKNPDLKFLGNNPPSTPLHPKNLPSSLQRKERLFFVQRVGGVWEPPNAEKGEKIHIQQRQRLHLVPKFTLKRAEFEAEDWDFFRVHWRHSFKRLLLGSACRNRNDWIQFQPNMMLGIHGFTSETWRQWSENKNDDSGACAILHSLDLPTGTL